MKLKHLEKLTEEYSKKTFSPFFHKLYEYNIFHKNSPNLEEILEDIIVDNYLLLMKHLHSMNGFFVKKNYFPANSHIFLLEKARCIDKRVCLYEDSKKAISKCYRPSCHRNH